MDDDRYVLPRYVIVDDTTWPVNLTGVQWCLRYGSSELVVEQRYVVASVVAAYQALTDPTISEADAIEALKRARAAATEGLARRVTR